MASPELSLQVLVPQNQSKVCRLLSLPRELRLEIWRYALTAPSTSLILHIDQGRTESTLDSPPTYQRSSNALRQHTRFQTFVKATLEPRVPGLLGAGILRVSRLVYREALPLLYRAVTLAPKSMFGEFLDTLSDFARLHVFKIRLKMVTTVLSEQHFNWAVMCAQVATLPGLRIVEVQRPEEDRSLHDRHTKRALRSLVKIKVPKILVAEEDDDDAVQKVLHKIEKEMDAERTAKSLRANVLGTSREQSTNASVVQPTEANKTHATDRGSAVSAALQRAIARHLHAQDDPAWAIANAFEWDTLSTASEDLESDEIYAELATGTEERQSNSDDERSLSVDGEDWEVVDSKDYNSDTERT